MAEPSGLLAVGDDEDDDLQKALAMSLQEHHHQPALSTASSEEDDDLRAALAMSLETTTTSPAAATAAAVNRDAVSQQQQPDVKLPAARTSSTTLDIDTSPLPKFNYQTDSQPFDLKLFHSLMWDTSTTTENDKRRWVQQGILTQHNDDVDNNTITPATDLERLEQLAVSHLPWGLMQQHGGPCGVLAAVQAEMLRHLIWGPLSNISSSSEEALARAIAIIVTRAAVVPYAPEDSKLKDPTVRVVLPADRRDVALTWDDMRLDENSDDVESNRKRRLMQFTLRTQEISDEEGLSKRLKTNDDVSSSDDRGKEEALSRIVASFLLQAPTTADEKSLGVAPIQHFRQPGGVLLLVMSLIASRTHLSDEFDDGAKLTGQFGHCSQELLNLCLTGQAVSNVFDYTMRPSGDELVCRGISSQPLIGYLTQLESLRYCEVGSFYKSPKYPIWVVGSQSHFTVLWGPRAALNESRSDALLEQCRRAFKSVEGGDNGFVATNQIGAVLQQLPVELDDVQTSLLGASLEVNGAGIVLWDDFWKVTSRLLMGASFQSVLDDSVPPPLVRMESAAAPSSTQSGGDSMAVESDEEMARRLQSEWSQADMLAGERVLDTSSVGGINGGDSPLNLPSVADQQDAGEEAVQTDLVSFDGTPSPASFTFERLGDTFPLYHYNGLRGGLLTSFRVTRLSAEEAVGASIALSRGIANGGSSSMDLEDVVRTKFPSCAINWLGKSPPYID